MSMPAPIRGAGHGLRGEMTRAVLVLLGLLALKGIHAAGWPSGRIGEWRDSLASTLTSRGLNKEAREALNRLQPGG